MQLKRPTVPGSLVKDHGFHKRQLSSSMRREWNPILREGRRTSLASMVVAQACSRQEGQRQWYNLGYSVGCNCERIWVETNPKDQRGAVQHEVDTLKERAHRRQENVRNPRTEEVNAILNAILEDTGQTEARDGRGKLCSPSGNSQSLAPPHVVG